MRVVSAKKALPPHEDGAVAGIASKERLRLFDAIPPVARPTPTGLRFRSFFGTQETCEAARRLLPLGKDDGGGLVFDE